MASLTISQYLIIFPLAWLAGFVDSIAGGGGLISLPAFLMAGFPAQFASGTNKLSATMGTTLATVRYARLGYVDWSIAGACAAIALGSSMLGARFALMLDEQVLKMTMVIILPLIALYVMRSRALKSDEALAPLPKRITLAICAASALLIGFYDGAYGPGTGTFYMLLFTGTAHMNIRAANGITKVINLSSNIAALSVLASNGRTVVAVGLTAGVFNLIGNYIGSKMFDRGGAKVARPIIVAVLALFFIKMVYEIASGSF